MKKLTLIITFFVLSSVFAETQVKTHKVEQKNTGSISGNLQGLGNAYNLSVNLYNSNGVFIKSSYYNDGRFNFTGLSNGSYYLLGYNDNDFWSFNYEGLPTLYGNRLCISATSPLNFCDNVTIGTPIQVTQGQAVTDINFSLIEGSKISGSVKNIANQEMAATMNVYRQNQSGDFLLYYSIHNGYLSANNGNYTFHGLTTGNYKVKAKSYSHFNELYNDIRCFVEYCQLFDGQVLTIPNQNTHKTAIDFKLTPSERALVTFNFNTLQENGYLHVVNTANNNYEHTFELSAGTSTITKYLNTGNYRFFFAFDDDSKHFSKYWGGPNCIQNSNCLPSTGSSIGFNTSQHRVLHTQIDTKFELNLSLFYNSNVGNSVPSVTIYKNNNVLTTFQQNNNPSTTYVPTTGDIKLKVDMPGFNSNIFNGINCFEECQISQGQSIHVGLGQTSSIGMGLTPLMKINGRIYNSQNNFVPNRLISLYKIENSILVSVGSTMTNTDGQYSFQGALENGVQYLLKGNGDQDHFDTFNGGVVCDTDCDPTSYQTFSLTNNQTHTADLFLKAKGQLNIDYLKYFSGVTADSVRVSIHRPETSSIVTSAYTNSSGQILNWKLPLQSFKMSFRYNGLYAVYPGIICQSVVNSDCLSQGETLTVPAAQSVLIDDAILNERGIIQVTTLDNNNQSLSGIKVFAIDSNSNVIDTATSDANGSAILDSLGSHPYYLLSQSEYGFQYATNLYPDVTCPGGLGTGCHLNDGIAVSAEVNAVEQVNVIMNENPLVNASLTDEFTHDTIEPFQLYLYDESQTYLGEFNLTSSDSFNMEPGNYFLMATSNFYNPTTWPHHKCTYVSLSYCDDTALLTIDDSNNQVINIAASRKSGLYFEVIDGETDLPIAGAIIDIWHSQANVDSAQMNALGRGVTAPTLSTYNNYRVSTEIGMHPYLFNEIHDNIQCVDGSVASGLCNLEQGNLVEIESNSESPQIHQFILHGDPIFNSTFE